MRFDRFGLSKEWKDERLKGMDIFDFPQELQDKIENANDRVKELKNEGRAEEMRKKADELIPEFFEWCKSKKMEEITPLAVNVFLFESKIDLPMNAMAYLHFYATEKFNITN